VLSSLGSSGPFEHRGSRKVDFPATTRRGTPREAEDGEEAVSLGVLSFCEKNDVASGRCGIAPVVAPDMTTLGTAVVVHVGIRAEFTQEATGVAAFTAALVPHPRAV
jgi:hypothetical protein